MCAAAIEQARVPIPFLRQRSRDNQDNPLRSDQRPECRRRCLGIVATPIIAMPTAPAATRFCTSVLFVVIKVAAFSQRRGGGGGALTRMRQAMIFMTDGQWQGAEGVYGIVGPAWLPFAPAETPPSIG